jgi:hypothetical protein
MNESHQGSMFGQTLINSHHLSKVTSPTKTQVNFVKEIRTIIRGFSLEDVPEVACLQRLLEIE